MKEIAFASLIRLAIFLAIVHVIYVLGCTSIFCKYVEEFLYGLKVSNLDFDDICVQTISVG